MTLVVTGVVTAICVETTIRDAFHRDYRCILVDDCTWEKLAEMERASKMVISLTLVQESGYGIVHIVILQT